MFILPSFRMVPKFRNMYNKKIRTGTTLSASSFFTHTHLPLFDLYTTANDKSWCEVQNALKAEFKEKVHIFDFSDFNSSSEMVRSRCTFRFLSIQHSEIFLEISRIV